MLRCSNRLRRPVHSTRPVSVRRTFMSTASSHTALRHDSRLRCSHCHSPLFRVARDLWMRFLPGSRHLECHGCEKRYLVFLGLRLGPL